VELGGQPDFSPVSLNYNGHASYDDAHDLKSMIRSHLVAEHAAIETYAQIIDVLSGSDPVTQKLIEGIVLDELDHAGSINDWLGQVGTGRGNGQHGPALLHSPCTAVPKWEGDRP
jgi:bacterioferritin